MDYGGARSAHADQRGEHRHPYLRRRQASVWCVWGYECEHRGAALHGNAAYVDMKRDQHRHRDGQDEAGQHEPGCDGAGLPREATGDGRRLIRRPGPRVPRHK
jgi:hypothetical protein